MIGDRLSRWIAPGAAMLLICTLLAVATASESSASLEMTVERYRIDGAELALPEFVRLRTHFVQTGDLANAAKAERYIAECHWRLGEYLEARSHLDRALEQSRQLGLESDEAKVLNVFGLLSWDLGDYSAAIAHFREAERIAEQLGDPRLAGATLNNLSLVYDELGQYETSLTNYRRALELYDGIDFPRGQSDTLGNIGGVHLLLGRFEEARKYYERALAISDSLQATAAMSLDHGNLGLCFLGLGRPETALRHFDKAIALARKAGMRKEEALWLRGKGNALVRSGKYDLGLQHHRSALEIYRAIEARGLLLDSLHDMGELHLTLGDVLSAETFYEQALDLAKRIGLTRGITVNMLALGDVSLRRQQHSRSRGLYEEALQRATAAGEVIYQAQGLLRLAAIDRELGDFVAAEKKAREAERISADIGARFTLAEARLVLGEASRSRGHAKAALDHYARAVEATPEFPDPEVLWQVHYGRAKAQLQLGDREGAVSELKTAAGIIEGIRSRLQEERFKAGYLQDRYKVYVDLVRLQLELGRARAAFSAAERLRARGFLEQMERDQVLSADPESRERELALRERIRQLRKSLEEEESTVPAQRRQAAIDTFSRELMLAEREYQSFVDDFQSRSPVDRLRASAPAVEDIQARLALDEALLEYVVGDEEIIIFLVRRESLTPALHELKYSDLSAKVALIRDLIAEPSATGWREPAASLSHSLLHPLEQQGLLDGVKHLYLVPHDILNYLPFSLLPVRAEGDKDPVLIERYSLTRLPAAGMLLEAGQTTRDGHSLLALAPSSARLRFAVHEARSISHIYRPESRLLEGSAATETAFKSVAGQFNVLHLSTHGFFNVHNPLLSGLELEPDDANDGRLEVHEILRLSLDASLVTLSACETGLSSGYFNRIPAGDEFVGLTRAFLLAGSDAVLATLWKVDDRSTVELMKAFYLTLNAPGNSLGQANALARVQRQLKASETYGHPFFWAPFVLVGRQHQQITKA